MKKLISGYDNYYIDELGNVYKNNIKLKPSDNGVGYLNIKLKKDGYRKHYYVHRLVWETFNGVVPQGYEINHKDHNKYNNELSNLEIVTHSENLHKSFLQYGYYGSMNRPK